MEGLKIKRTEADWIKIVQRCRESKIQVKAWCKTNQISIRSYYYWHKKLLSEEYKKSADITEIKGNTGSKANFVEIICPQTQKSNKESPFYIYKQDLQIEITHEATKEEMAELLSALSEIC